MPIDFPLCIRAHAAFGRDCLGSSPGGFRPTGDSEKIGLDPLWNIGCGPPPVLSFYPLTGMRFSQETQVRWLFTHSPKENRARGARFSSRVVESKLTEP